eukprot:5811033-Pleurochrysis_carterae.AAC.2
MKSLCFWNLRTDGDQKAINATLDGDWFCVIAFWVPNRCASGCGTLLPKESSIPFNFISVTPMARADHYGDTNRTVSANK